MNDGRVWWTDERVEELKARWKKGETGTQIKWAMGAKSRSAVVGKVHRLKLEPRAHANGARSNGSNGRRKRVRTKHIHTTIHHIDGLVFVARGETTVIEEPPESFKNPKLFIELDADDCHWPAAGPTGPNLLFCAAPIVHGFAYCARHCRIAYQPGYRSKARP